MHIHKNHDNSWRKKTSNCKQGRRALVCVSMKYVSTRISRRCNTSPEALRDVVRIFTKQVATARRSNIQKDRNEEWKKKKEWAHAFDQITSTIKNDIKTLKRKKGKARLKERNNKSRDEQRERKERRKETHLRPVEPFSDRLHRRAVEDVGRLTGESSLRFLRPKHLRHSETCYYNLTRKRHTTRHQPTAYEFEFFRQVSPSNIRPSTNSVELHIRN